MLSSPAWRLRGAFLLGAATVPVHPVPASTPPHATSSVRESSPAQRAVAEEPTDAELRRFSDYYRAPRLVLGGRVEVHWLDGGGSFWFETAGSGYRVDTATATVESLAVTPPRDWKPTRERSRGERVFSPDFERYVVSAGSGLSLYEEGADDATRLAEAGEGELSWRVGPESWSPDGARLAATRVDLSRVHRLPIIDYSQAEESVSDVPYAKTGGGFMRLEVVLFDLAGGRRVTAEIGADEDLYVFPVGWREDGSEYLLLRLTRDARRLDLMAVDPTTGASRAVVTETRETFVGGLDFITGGYEAFFTPIAGSDRFLWLSERDGWRHVYLYDLEGESIGQLTRGEFPVLEVEAVDPANGLVYFTANAEERLYDTHLYRVGLDGSGFRRLTEGDGEHRVQFSPRLDCFVDTHSSSTRPPVSELRSAAGELLLTISRADTSRLEALGWSPPEEFVVKADDGLTDLYGVLYKPADFDPEGSYPVIDMIYAGPFITTVPNSFAPASAWAVRAQAMAQLGFVTFLVDCRGTTERGKAFQDASFGRIGQIEIPDHVATLRQLAERRPYMDLERVGIMGASWGGYFALRGMLTAPDVFHVGVAVAPGDLTELAPINEPYMGLPEENPEGYAAGSNPALAAKLKGKLLLVHGTADRNAPFSTTMRMSAALIRAGKLHDLAVLPQADHFFRDHNGPYFTRLAISYFREHLGTCTFP